MTEPAEKVDIENDKVIYLIVRNDLKMGKGKIAAQCGHAIQYTLRHCDDTLYKQYEQSGSPKICLKVETYEDFHSLRLKLYVANIRAFTVVDAGHTQVEANTETCFAIGPVSKEKVKEFIKDLKLL